MSFDQNFVGSNPRRQQGVISKITHNFVQKNQTIEMCFPGMHCLGWLSRG